MPDTPMTRPSGDTPVVERPDCDKCGHPARYHINFAHEGKPKPPGPPDIPRKQNFCRHPTTRSFCACPDYIAKSGGVGAVTAWACCGNPTRYGHNPTCPKFRESSP